MVARDTVTRSRKWRPGPAVVILLLAVLLVTASALREGVELRFFDFLQRQHRDAGSPRVVLLDTTDLQRPSGASLWHAADFPQLLRTIGGAGARLIVPVQPPPAGLALPDLSRLAELQDLERRTSATAGDSGQDTQSLETFTRQLDGMRNQFEQQAKVIQAASASHTLLFSAAWPLAPGVQPRIIGLRRAAVPIDRRIASRTRRSAPGQRHHGTGRRALPQRPWIGVRGISRR